MRYAALALALAIVGNLAISAQSKPEQELIQIENDWCAADLKQDAAALGRILHADYTSVGSRGNIDTKETTLAAYKDKSSPITACTNSNMKVRIYGDTAVVVGNVSTSGSFKGTPFKDRQRLFTDTFIRRDGRWQCIASQGTLVAAQQK